MDDSRKGREKDDAEAGPQRDTDASEEAVEEREPRVRMATQTDRKPTYVSQATGTSDDPFPRRKKKKPIRLPPGTKIPQTPQTSMDSMDYYQPASEPSSRYSSQSTSQPSSKSSRSEKTSSEKSQDVRRRNASTSEEEVEVEIRADRYSRQDILRSRSLEDRRSTSQSARQTSIDIEERDTVYGSREWHASIETLNMDTEGWVAGLTGFISTAMAIVLIIIISWFIIKQLDFIMWVVTLCARAFEEALSIFHDGKGTNLIDSEKLSIPAKEPPD
nr:uncharacterized protein LOC108133225 [Drosophila bipectinata]